MRMKFPITKIWVLIAMSVLWGLVSLSAFCAKPDPLVVLCGAAIRPPMAESAAEFEKKTGQKLQLTYGASNLLLGQLSISKDGDIFIPGDEWYTDEAHKRGLVEKPDVVAYFVPVIMVAKGNPKRVNTLKDLTKSGLRLGLADERTAAIGLVSLNLFRRNDISLEEVKRNTVYHSTTAPELGNALKLGHIDAAINYMPVASLYSADCDIVSIPDQQNIISSIPIAVIKSSNNKDAARRFIDFILSTAGQNIFKKHHYSLSPKGSK